MYQKIIELQTREPQFATDENGETLYDEETNEPIYNESTLPIAKPVIKITKDIKEVFSVNSNSTDQINKNSNQNKTPLLSEIANEIPFLETMSLLPTTNPYG